MFDDNWFGWWYGLNWGYFMKVGIYLEYKVVNVICFCGNFFVFNFILGKDIMYLDVCDKCYLFYFGK